eukprot:TRINITY_DN67746_c6_g2_i1.p1 TRINITY_DN67746_c6_g2~~TRINITY_DN67746_c6_g2_i1.p1  ORF type:complete len:982 (-),score=96.27 TRINITY_DN67746_c6_g2_i1:209-3082(-)
MPTTRDLSPSPGPSSSGGSPAVREPARISNLRRRLTRIQNTKALISSGVQPDPRQVKALEAETEIVWEIEQFEKHRLLYPNRPEERYVPEASREGASPPPSSASPVATSSAAPSSPTLSLGLLPPQREDSLSPFTVSSAATPDHGDTTSTTGGTPSQQGQGTGTPKEPTRIVNLRRRLQRIQRTKQKLAQGYGEQPDSRQLIALEAEPDIIWEIEQWEKHGVLVQQQRRESEGGTTSPAGPPSREKHALTPDALQHAAEEYLYPSDPVKQAAMAASPVEQEVAKEERGSVSRSQRSDGTMGDNVGTNTTEAHIELWRAVVDTARIEEKKKKIETLLATVPDRRESCESFSSLLSIDAPPSRRTSNMSDLMDSPPSRRTSDIAVGGIFSPLPSPFKTPPTSPLRNVIQMDSPVASPGFKQRSLYMNLVRQAAPDSPATRIRRRGGSLLEGKYYNELFDEAVETNSPMKKFRSLSLGSEAGYAKEDSDSFAAWLKKQTRYLREARSLSTPSTPAKEPKEDRSEGGESVEPRVMFGGTMTIGSAASSPPAPPTGVARVTTAIPALRRQSTHFLENSWTIWFDETGRRGMDRVAYEDIIQELGSFNTIQGFWMYWNNLRVGCLKTNCNLRLFKTGIKPTWEDPHNAEGGKYVARNLPREKRNELWCNMVMSMVGELIEDNSNESICGVVLSTKDSGDAIQLWTDGGHQFRVKPSSVYHLEEYRESRPPMGEALKALFADHSDVKFTYQPQNLNKMVKDKNSRASPVPPAHSKDNTTPTAATQGGGHATGHSHTHHHEPNAAGHGDRPHHSGNKRHSSNKHEHHNPHARAETHGHPQQQPQHNNHHTNHHPHGGQQPHHGPNAQPHSGNDHHPHVTTNRRSGGGHPKQQERNQNEKPHQHRNVPNWRSSEGHPTRESPPDNWRQGGGSSKDTSPTSSSGSPKAGAGGSLFSLLKTYAQKDEV